jgi:tRNA-2-methylthio-N6-dimethylallyladenosine synthase
MNKLGESMGREFLVYYTSPHPRDMSPDVIYVMSQGRFIGPQVHLPMQSGDDSVLVRMNRKHTMERYRELVGMIREKMPQATLFTDIIVGFPGETEQQFLNTAAAMKEFRFNMAYIAQYSPRPGAASHRWPDDIPSHEKKRRLHYLTEILEDISADYNKQLEGKTLRVLVTGEDRKKGFLSGLTAGKIIVRFAEENKKLIGSFIDLKISSSTAFSLEGELESRMAATGV